MAEQIAFENGWISNFKGLVTFTLTLDWVIRHNVVHHSSTCTYMPNFIEIEETFCGQTNRQLRPALLRRLCQRVDLKRGRVTLIISLDIWRYGCNHWARTCYYQPAYHYEGMKRDSKVENRVVWSSLGHSGYE